MMIEISKKDRAFKRKIWRRHMAGKKISRRDILRAIDIQRALRREDEVRRAKSREAKTS
jgi:hypothetical protein